MKTKAFFLIALTAAMMTSCMKPIRMITESAKNELKALHEYRDSEKWGKVIEKDIEFEGLEFCKIQIDGNVEVHFTQDSICSVKAFGNEKAIEQYQFMCNTSSEGLKTLVVNLKDFAYDKTKENHNVNKDTPAITVFVSAPTMNDVTVYGAGDINFENDLTQAESLNIEINGAGDFDAKEMELANFKATINGAGDISIKKIICEGNADMIINGAGDIDSKVKCSNAFLQVNGAGNVGLNVECNELTAQCNGAGDIKLKGECNKLIKSDGPLSGIDSRNLRVNDKVEIEK